MSAPVPEPPALAPVETRDGGAPPQPEEPESAGPATGAPSRLGRLRDLLSSFWP